MIKYLLLSLGLPTVAFSQNFTKTDTLKGSNTAFRDFWDVKHYKISVEPDFKTKMVKGENIIDFEIIKDVKNPVFQIDLQQPMAYRLINSDPDFHSRREGDFIFVQAVKSYKKGEKGQFKIEFSGQPHEAKKAPWDGGWVFSTDPQGNPFMSVAQEGIGASVWLPVKDIWSDEPDNGTQMKIITPKNLVGVGNGRLISKKSTSGKNEFVWEVKNPINAYSMVPTVGNFINFKDQYVGAKGRLDLDYWVLQPNLEKAKKQFSQVKPMLKAFEYWFGPYPFYEDSYKIVEAPYLGMEHQSAVAYGNGYVNGYKGTDLSHTGVGLNWDFIIIHESGHEWFANSITAKDQADMWVHESFTNYSEVLFTEKLMDKASAEAYVMGIRKNIQNDIPIVGRYGVRSEGSGDMYYKGANMLHTIRQIINDDEKFRQILRGMNREFYHKTVTGSEVEAYISKKAGIDFSTIFDQYLRTVRIPTLEFSQNGNTLNYRWTDTVPNFKLPLRVGDKTILPSDQWQTVSLNSDTPVIWDENYFVNYHKVVKK